MVLVIDRCNGVLICSNQRKYLKPSRHGDFKGEIRPARRKVIVTGEVNQISQCPVIVSICFCHGSYLQAYMFITLKKVCLLEVSLKL